MDPLASFKEEQKLRWAHFAPLGVFSAVPAARLVKFAGVKAGQRVLDVACGTGVVAVTAARSGAQVSGIDLTPHLLEFARENSRIAEVEVDWRQGDVEALPYQDAGFDVVLSQYGHMFAPRPEVAVAEMLRVLKPGGILAFSTWPPEFFVGRGFLLAGAYLPPLPAGIAPPPLWGVPEIIRQRLGSAVSRIEFDVGRMTIPALSPQHFRAMIERTAGPIVRLVETLSASDPEKLAEFRRQYEALAAEYFEENQMRQDYLMTRAVKIKESP
ncbi:MAG TPA: class I SAM-dependent methyltransferase [bacterium]|nr:class I SAM-dependent methyltransferase [bacterium]